jgi:hypothetical protein
VVLHAELLDEGRGTVRLLLRRLLVPLQLLVQPALAVGVVGEASLVEVRLAAGGLRQAGLGVLVFVGPFYLPLQPVHLPHVVVEVGGRQRVLLDLCERVGTVLLEVLFVGECGPVRRTASLPLSLSQSLEIVVAGVQAELSFVVLELVRAVKAEVTFQAGVIVWYFDVGIHIIMGEVVKEWRQG